MSLFDFWKKDREISRLKKELEQAEEERYIFRYLNERHMDELKELDELKRKIALFESDPFKDFISRFYNHNVK